MPDTPYSVITISFLCLLCYGVSVLFVRWRIITDTAQRRIWNTLLLLSVLIAGCIGLLLAVTVNFKINMPISDKLLVWHVDFGAALFVIAIFHFTWHIKYYRFIFKIRRFPSETHSAPVSRPLTEQPEYQLGFNLKRIAFSLGFTAMATQLILLREFLSVFNGNELVIGIVLGNWMLLSGLGALMNRKNLNNIGPKGILKGLFTLSVIPVVTLFQLYWLRNIILPVGGMPGLAHILFGTGILLAPFCLLSGWLFSAISNYLSQTLKQNAISLTYGWETIGSIAAGILCSMILVFLFEPFQNLAIVLVINSVILYLVSRKEIFKVRKKFHLYLAGAVLIAAATFIAGMDRGTLQFVFPQQEIISFRDTPYGKLVVTENDGQLNFYENNTLLFTTNNIIANEETVHYALLQRPDSGNVLLVGGGISGAADECLKYPLKRLDCFEINPRIHVLGKKFKRLPDDARFCFRTGDPRLLLNKAALKKRNWFSCLWPDTAAMDSVSYDAIILNLPEPATLQINRFYTLEFFTNLKTLLVQKGIITLSLLPTADYVGKDALPVQATIYQTLKLVFKNVLVIAGEKNYFLASDGPLTPAVTNFANIRGIPTEYVNEFYLDDESLQERSDAIIQRISQAAPINKDFNPVGNYRQLNYWLSYQGRFGSYFIVIPLLLLLLAGALRSAGTTVALFSAGLTSFSLEIILILTFQIIYGYVYLVTGIFITLFMAGLAAGVIYTKQFPGRLNYASLIILQLISGVILLISLGFIFLFRNFQEQTILIHLVFSLLIVCIAAIAGAQFHIASVIKSGGIKQVAAINYSAELLGSATGALLVNVWLVPLCGIINSLLIITGFVALTSVLMIVKKHS